MTALDFFSYAFALVCGVGLGAILVEALRALAQNWAWALNNLIMAAERYAVRNEVVTEYYDACNMEHVRRITDAKPYRVTVAKKKAAK